MKKGIIFLIIILIHTIPVSAFEGTVEPVTSYPLVYEGYKPPDVVEFNGVKYMWNSMMSTCHPVKYDPATYDFFMGFNGPYDCIYTGEYYVVRLAGSDYSAWSDKIGGTLEIYNTDFKLVNRATFDSYVNGLGYYEGVLYCSTKRSGTWQSTDMVSWTKLESGEPFVDQIGSAVYSSSNDSGKVLKKISIAGSEFYNIAYENTMASSYVNYFACGVFGSVPSKVFLSSDLVYPVSITYLQDYDLMSKEPWVYEYGDNLVIEWRIRDRQGSSYRLTTPKQPVYDALEEQKSAPYVCVNSTLLGFETPPVTESDRMLVPMRFLFEQFGAEVSWDEAAETATAVKDDTTIGFTIDNTTAIVNGAATTMDVPARLVGDKTMVPLRFLSEEMGYTVEWDEETRMATITAPNL